MMSFTRLGRKCSCCGVWGGGSLTRPASPSLRRHDTLHTVVPGTDEDEGKGMNR